MEKSISLSVVRWCSMFGVFGIGKMSCLQSQVKEAIEHFGTGNRLEVLCMCVLGKYELDTNVVN